MLFFFFPLYIYRVSVYSHITCNHVQLYGLSTKIPVNLCVTGIGVYNILNLPVIMEYMYTPYHTAILSDCEAYVLTTTCSKKICI